MTDKTKENSRRYYYKHQEEMKARGRKYYSEHREQLRERLRTVSEHSKEVAKLWRNRNKEHIKEYQQKWEAEHLEQQKENRKRWREENKERRKAYQKEYCAKNREQLRNYRFGYKYGISMSEYNDLFVKQDGKCAICGNHQEELNKDLFVDHNHETGKVRGLLCERCNFVLGFAHDDIKIFFSAIKYLEIHNDISR